MESKEELCINVEMIVWGVFKSHYGESPEDMDAAKREAFYGHKNHFFILTAAGKPIYTR
jgi:hypothetical protein